MGPFNILCFCFKHNTEVSSTGDKEMEAVDEAQIGGSRAREMPRGSEEREKKPSKGLQLLYKRQRGDSFDSSTRPKKRKVAELGQKEVALSPEEQKEQLRSELAQLHKQDQDVQKKIASDREELKKLQQRAEAERPTKALLETRSKELHEASHFINTTDSVYPNKIKQDIDKLNKSIADIASKVASPASKKFSLDDTGRETIKAILGDEFIPIFETPKRINANKGSTLKAVIQMLLCRSVMPIMNAWQIGNDKVNNFLDSHLYQCIVETEEQRISGKWREITFEHYLQKTSEAEDMKKLSEKVYTAIKDLIRIAGAGRKTAPAGDELLRGEIQALLQFVQRIRMGIKQHVRAYDLRPFYLPCGTVFDESEMYKIIPEAGNDERLLVLGSTEIGLKVFEQGIGLGDMGHPAGVVLQGQL